MARIVFAPDLNGTINLLPGQMEITQSLTLRINFVGRVLSLLPTKSAHNAASHRLRSFSMTCRSNGNGGEPWLSSVS